MTSSLFSSKRLSNRITRITDISGVLMYLVEGNLKAVLIDAGLGIGNLYNFAKTLTALPIEVLLTHGHLDHVGGAVYFDKVYMSHKDIDLSKKHNTYEMRRGYLDFIGVSFQFSDFAPFKQIDYLPLNHGDTFDLDGTTIEIIEFAGHTQGSVAVLIKEEKAIVFGDACNTFTFIFDDYCSKITEYLEICLNVKNHEKKWDTIYLSHGSGDVSNDLLDGVIQVSKDIIDRNVDDVPFNFMGQTVAIAKAMTPEFDRVDGLIGNIVYNPKRI